jgi:uncharacterized protein (DUF1778 family)
MGENHSSIRRQVSASLTHERADLVDGIARLTGKSRSEVLEVLVASGLEAARTVVAQAQANDAVQAAEVKS